jgi:hypothetical protein
MYLSGKSLAQQICESERVRFNWQEITESILHIYATAVWLGNNHQFPGGLRMHHAGVYLSASLTTALK